MQRRNFIGFLTALAGAFWLHPSNWMASPASASENAFTSVADNDAFWKIVREQFLFPQDFVYLNTGGIGAVPIPVLNQVEESMRQGEIYPSPGHDSDKWWAVKEKIATLLGSSVTREEIALTSTATEGINIILNGLPLKRGDEVITSTHEHPALHVPLLNRLQRDGIVIRTFDPDLATGLNNIHRIEKLINRRTRLIFISHVTCTTGQCFPVQEIGRMAREKNIWFAADGAQAVGQVPVDPVESNIDFFAFSGHKWILGPKRTGVLYIRQELFDTLKPTTVGAYSDDGFDVNKLDLHFQPSAQKYEYATQNEALFHGLGRAVDFIGMIGLNKIHTHNRELAEAFYNGLLDIPHVAILSPKEETFRTSMITFKITNRPFREVASYLAEKRIRVRTVNEANLEAIRVSFHLYNSMSDVEMIIEEIKTQAGT